MTEVTTEVSAVQPAEPTDIERALQNNGQLIVAKAKSMTIYTEQDYSDAAQYLKEIKASADRVKAYWSGPKQSAKAAHQAVVDREKGMLKPLQDAEVIIRSLMGSYLQAVEQARRAEEEAARKRQQEESERLLQQAIDAYEAGDDQAAAVSMAMADMVEQMPAASSIQTPKVSGISHRKTWKARVTDPNAVPAYFNGMEIRKIDMSSLNKIASMTKGTASIPGVELFEDVTIAARS